MAPVDPSVHNSNVQPLVFFGTQATLISAALANVVYFFFYAHRSLPPSKHTRSKHVTEHRRLAFFIGLGILSSFVTLFSKINWLVASYREWSYEHNIHIPNTLFESGYSHVLGNSGIPLGLWYQDARILRQFYYGILESPSMFGMICQVLIGITPWSLFVGIEGKSKSPHEDWIPSSCCKVSIEISPGGFF
jgi:hypothetical protein